MATDSKSIRALLIEDSKDDVLLLINELKRGNLQPSYSCVDTHGALHEALQNEWDIVFCDYSMPTLNGMQALAIVRQHSRDVPFIFVSGTIGEEQAVDAMRIGAQDYIMKGNLKRLVPAVRRELEDASDRKMRRQAEGRLHFLAHYDELTGLPNRNQFLLELNSAIKDATDSGQLIAVAYLDLDHFKTTNNSLGYDAGNLLLQMAAERLKDCVDSSCIIARLGADEFTILLRDAGSREEVSQVMSEIQQAMAEPFDIHGCILYIGVSIGLALCPEDAIHANTIMRNADIAKCRVKREGGKHFRFYTADMAVRLDERLELDHAMRQALPRQEFLLHYQPQVETATGLISAVEVLVRWNRDHKTMIAPCQFIPLAEETGFILPLGEWILRQACIQAQQWHSLGFPLRIAVNVSARQFYQDDLIPMVKAVLDEYSLKPDFLEVEITESAIIQDAKRALNSLDQLQDLGVKVALDDFGTGYSSLTHLKDFKVDTLKIDRSFVMGIPFDKDAMAITAAVIAMAAKLGIRVVAEGVETREQYEFLKAEGCEFVQGYFLGRPVSAAQTSLLLLGKIAPGS